MLCAQVPLAFAVSDRLDSIRRSLRVILTLRAMRDSHGTNWWKCEERKKTTDDYVTKKDVCQSEFSAGSEAKKK